VIQLFSVFFGFVSVLFRVLDLLVNRLSKFPESHDDH